MKERLRKRRVFLEDIEYLKDLKLFQLVHYKNSLVNVKEYSLQYKDSDKPVFQGLSFDIKRVIVLYYPEKWKWKDNNY